MKNEDLIKKKNINNYDDLINKYHYLLEYYLSTKINFQKYEKKINESNLYIGKNPKYRKLNYYLNLDYIFLINRLFIEKLSLEDLDLLKKFNKDIDNNLVMMIKRTFKDIIYDNYLKTEYVNDIYKVCYGDFIPDNLVNNNALVLKIYYGKNTKDLDEDAFIDNHLKQELFFKELINELKKDIEKNFDVPCEILLAKDIY